MQHSSAHQTLHTTTTSPHTKDWLEVHGGNKCPLKSKSSRGKQLNALSSSVCVKLRICAADTIDEFLPHLHKSAFRLRKRGVECTLWDNRPERTRKSRRATRMIYVSGSNAIFHGPSARERCVCISKCLDLSQTMRCWFCGRARMGWHHVRTRSGPKNYLIESIINLLAAFNCQLLSRPHAECARECHHNGHYDKYHPS